MPRCAAAGRSGASSAHFEFAESPSSYSVTSNSWLPAVPPLPVGGPADSAAAAALRSESARCRWSELHLKESRLADRPTRTVCATLTVTVARCLPRPVALGPTATVARFLPAGLGIFSTIMTTAPPPATVTTSPSTAPLCQWTIPPRPGPVVQPPGPPAPPPVTGNSNGSDQVPSHTSDRHHAPPGPGRAGSSMPVTESAESKAGPA